MKSERIKNQCVDVSLVKFLLYCASEGLIEPTGRCSEGFFCGGGSSDMTLTSMAPMYGYEISESENVSCTSLDAYGSVTLNSICPHQKQIHFVAES